MAEKTFKLSRSIKTHGDKGAIDVTELKLREPSADEVFDLGFPFRFVEFTEKEVQKRETIVDGAVLKKWVSRLSGVGLDSIGAIHPRDLQGVIEWLGDELRQAGGDVKN